MSAVLVSGNFVVDLIGKPMERLPERGRLEILDTLEAHVGGNGPNTSAALARLGVAVSVAGCVGDDLFGRFLTEKLSAEGVDLSGLVVLPGVATGVTLVAVGSDGERSFMHHFGANAEFSPESLADVSNSGLRHYHLASFFVLPQWDGGSARRALRRARESGLTTSLDVCWDRSGGWAGTLAPCLPEVDWLIPSREEAEMLSGRSTPSTMARELIRMGAREVVIKLGEEGSYYHGSQGELHVPAFRVEAVDTTGAGDCFIAGFLLATLQGRPLPEALRFANACGAHAVMAVGALTRLRPAAEVEQWMSLRPAGGNAND